jgi:hypothetical protein
MHGVYCSFMVYLWYTSRVYPQSKICFIIRHVHAKIHSQLNNRVIHSIQPVNFTMLYQYLH